MRLHKFMLNEIKFDLLNKLKGTRTRNWKVILLPREKLRSCVRSYIICCSNKVGNKSARNSRITRNREFELDSPHFGFNS